MKKEFVKFIIVGISNTVLGMIIIFTLYNIFGLGYWLASGIGYIIGGIWSYFLNRYFTFEYRQKDSLVMVRFVVNMCCCYFAAYAIAKPLTIYVCSNMFSSLSEKIVEEVALLVGMGLYTILNYVGQKFFCFKSSNKV